MPHTKMTDKKLWLVLLLIIAVLTLLVIIMSLNVSSLQLRATIAPPSELTGACYAPNYNTTPTTFCTQRTGPDCLDAITLDGDNRFTDVGSLFKPGEMCDPDIIVNAAGADFEGCFFATGSYTESLVLNWLEKSCFRKAQSNAAAICAGGPPNYVPEFYPAFASNKYHAGNVCTAECYWAYKCVPVDSPPPVNNTPTLTPTSKITPTPTPTPTKTPTVTPKPNSTPTSTPKPNSTSTSTPKPASTP